MMKNFKYTLGQSVTITCSDEQGHVIARAQYSESSNQYLIRYKCADGRAVQSWWSESALNA